MRPFAQKQMLTQQAKSADSSHKRSFAGKHSIFALPAGLRSPKVTAEELAANLNPTISTRFLHNFSQISVHPTSQAYIQAKHSISQPSDSYEQEADRVADRVLRMPEPQIQGACACGGTCLSCQGVPQRSKPDRVQTKPAGTSSASQIAASPIVNEVLNSSGQPLDAATRRFMERRFGHDFSKVRIYVDDSAADSARALNALAYTVAPNIVFGAGRYAPQTETGRRLLAHELTHIVQQADGCHPFIQRQGVEEQVCQGPKVGDMFILDNTAVADPAELTTAMIHKRTQGILNAKHYKVGDWLNDEWEIVEISYQYIVVINVTCGTEETLMFERGELTPELSVGLNETNFGAGVVKIYNDFKRIVFESNDKSKPPREYRLETLRKEGQAPLTVYVLQSGDRTFYPPPDLENMLRLHLVGEKRGTPKPKPEIPEETWEDLTTSRP